jgi:hypothetical protein
MTKGTKRVFKLLLSFYLLLGVPIAIFTPFEGRLGFPDEENHFRYVQYIYERHALPRMDLPGKVISVAFHPPLYYLCAAPLLIVGPNSFTAVVLCRLFSLLLGGITLFLIWKCTLMVFPENSSMVSPSVAFAAFNPQFIFIHSGVSNIAMTSATCAFTTFLTLRLLESEKKDRRQIVFLGASFGAALLSRIIVAFLFVPATCAIVLRYRTQIGRALKNVALFGLTALCVGGWWYLWSWIAFGDPFQFNISRKYFGVGYVPDLTPVYFMQSLAFLHASYWAYFGRMEFHAGIVPYAVYLIIEMIALIGVLLIVAPRKSDPDFNDTAFRRTAFSLLALSAFLAIASIVFFNLKISSPQGRYLYMAIAPISVLLGAGSYRILPLQYRARGSSYLILFLLAMCVYLLASHWFVEYWR